MKKLIFLTFVFLSACSAPQPGKDMESGAAFISEATVMSVIDSIKADQPSSDPELLGRGIRHAASLWREDDGSPEEFVKFVKSNFISDPVNRKVVFTKISDYFESMAGNFNEITLDLRKTIDLSVGEIDEVDRMFGNYAVDSHLMEDFYTKIGRASCRERV